MMIALSIVSLLIILCYICPSAQKNLFNTIFIFVCVWPFFSDLNSSFIFKPHTFADVCVLPKLVIHKFYIENQTKNFIEKKLSWKSSESSKNRYKFKFRRCQIYTAKNVTNFQNIWYYSFVYILRSERCSKIQILMSFRISKNK